MKLSGFARTRNDFGTLERFSLQKLEGQTEVLKMYLTRATVCFPMW